MALKPHQEFGARWLAARPRALLADAPRVGKTATAIAASDYICAVSVLVVCPGIARENWAREYEKWQLLDRPIRFVMDKDDPIEPNGVTIVSMDGARSGTLHARIMEHTWDLMLVDEAQFLKEPSSKRTQQTLSKRGFAQKAARVWFLTGSPVLNHPGEAWVMLRTIGVWTGDYTSFLNRFARWFQGDYGPVVKGSKNVEELKRLMAPVMLRRTLKDVYPMMPDPTWIEVEVNPDDAWQDELENVLKMEANPKFGGHVKRLLEAVKRGEDVDFANAKPKTNLMLLRRATALAKVKAVSRWLKPKIDSGEIDKIVVFGHHGRMIEIIQEDFAYVGAKAIYGGTQEKRRQQAIDLFNTRANRRVLVVQDQIGRTAIDLSAMCNKLLFAELDWVPENNFQASMRIQGPKQTRPVTIWVAGMPRTTDALVTQALLRKTKMVSEILG